MSRKDYVRIAAKLAVEREKIIRKEILPHEQRILLYGFNLAMEAVIASLAEDNASFDADRFRDAVSK